MATTRWISIVVCAAGLTGSALCNAQPVAEKPDVQLGDLWVFRQIGTEMGKAVDRRWWRRVAELLPGGTMRVEPVYIGQAVFDESWNPRYSTRSDYPLDFKFPLRVGGEWSFSSSQGEHFQDGHHRVVAYETITVPAGTFDCFRLEGVSIYNEKTWKVNYSDTWRMTRWYCPRVKYIAKWHIERNSAVYFGYGLNHDVLDSELIYFVVSGVSPTQSQRLAAIPLPSDLTIVPPAESLPAEVKAFSGKWGGTWDFTLDHVLVVERINSPDNVVVIYARGRAPAFNMHEPWFGRINARIIDGVLSFPLRNGAVTYQPLSPGELTGTLKEGTKVSRINMKRIE